MDIALLAVSAIRTGLSPTEESVSDHLEETCARFNQLAWHDSKLISLRIYPSEDLFTHNVDFALRLLTNTKPGEYEWADTTLTAKDCRIIKLDLDLLGKQLCGGDIASGSCDMKSALKEKIETEELPDFDLPQGEHPLDEYLHFRILLIHPSGEINFFAKDFELLA
jgi:hypothetical protein